MKNNIILIFASFGSLFSEPEYTYSNSYSAGLNLISESSMIKYTKRNKNNPKSAYINKLKASYESKLLNEANRRLKISIENQKRMDRINQRAFNREIAYSSAWSFSSTGRSNQSAWVSLSPVEKKIYRERFLNYWSNTAKVDLARSKESKLEQEMSIAWARSNTGQNDGRTWRNLPKKEKDYYANNYLTRKNNNLLPTELPTIPQDEYKEAWLALQSFGSENKPWQQLTSIERGAFRKEYLESTYEHAEGLLAYK